MNFETDRQRKVPPIALRVFAGGVNAISGDVDLPSASHSEKIATEDTKSQNYVCIPEQPWLDGFKTSENEVR